MKVLHIAASMAPEWGGPVKAIQGLTEALVRNGIDVSIFAPFQKGKEKEVVLPKGVNTKLFPQDIFAKFWRNHSFALKKGLVKEINKFDLIHVHEIWHHSHFVAYRLTRKFNKPYVITIHGALRPWCLNYKTLKKRIFSSLFERQILEQASTLHAISEEEVKNIRAFGVNNTPIVTIPNGIDLQEFQNLPPKEELIKFYPQIKNQKIVLFLGRIHPIKGLDILAKAFGALLRKRKDVHLLIVGPDEGYKKEMVNLLTTENAMENTTFTGMLTGNKKQSALSAADIFVLPSYSEGLAITVLEAMAWGLPVVITKNCNFHQVGEAGAGMVIDADIDQLSNALIELLNNPKLCKEMGERGRSLILERYTWDKVADQMIILYEKVLSGKI